MPLLTIVVVLIVCGLLWFLVDLLPIPAPFKLAIKVIIIVALCLWLLSIVGVVNLGHIRVGR